MSLEAELERARRLATDEIATAIESIGFECTRCGACCKAINCGNEDGTSLQSSSGSDDISSRSEIVDTPESDDGREGSSDGTRADEHTATIFPDEIRRLQDAAEETFERSYDWRDVARPMPYGLRSAESTADSTSGKRFVGETFEWALEVDECGNCTFYAEEDGTGRCTVHDDRPLVCRTYPFSLVVSDDFELAAPLGSPVDREGPVRAHECEGLGRDIDRDDAKELARVLKDRAIRELEEAIALVDRYEPTDVEGVVVHDSEGAKRPDGSPL